MFLERKKKLFSNIQSMLFNLCLSWNLDQFVRKLLLKIVLMHFVLIEVTFQTIKSFRTQSGTQLLICFYFFINNENIKKKFFLLSRAKCMTILKYVEVETTIFFQKCISRESILFERESKKNSVFLMPSLSLMQPTSQFEFETPALNCCPISQTVKY